MFPQPDLEEHKSESHLGVEQEQESDSNSDEESGGRLIKHSDADLTLSGVDPEEEMRHDVNIHSDVINRTRSAMDSVTTSGLMAAFSFASLITIQVLYARSFTFDTALATWMLFLGELILITVGLVCMSFGYSYEYSWYFDNLLCILFGVSWFGLLWQLIAWDFGCWAFGYLFWRMPIILITFCYFKQILPYYDRREYTQRFNAMYGVCYCVAPLITSFIAYYGSLRWVIGLNLALYTLLLFFNYRNLMNRYKKLENDQLTLIRPIYDKNRIRKSISGQVEALEMNRKWIKSIDYRFPSCIYQDIRKYAVKESKKFYNIDLLLLFNCILQNAFIQGNLLIFLLYFTVHMYDKYSCNILVSLLQLSVFFLFYIIGMFLFLSCVWMCFCVLCLVSF